MNTNSQTTHAPSHLREQFQEWLDAFEPSRLHEIDIQPVASLLDALADCGDVLPADYCDQLEIPKGSTYAQAVADVRQWCAKKQGQSTPEPALESLHEAKARWESLLGVAVTPDEHGHLVLRSLTGFPLATMELSEGASGRYIPCFGQPIGAQSEWIKKQVDRSEPEPSAEDVYWEYAKIIGEEACEDAVFNYHDPSTVVEILLASGCIDAERLEVFFRENFDIPTGSDDVEE
jgi:hypothetical protein